MSTNVSTTTIDDYINTRTLEEIIEDLPGLLARATGEDFAAFITIITTNAAYSAPSLIE